MSPTAKKPAKKAAAKKVSKPAKKAAAPAKKVAAPKVVKKVEVKKATPKAATPKQAAPSPVQTQAPKPAAQKAQSAASQKAPQETPKLKGIRIRLSAFDHSIIDEAALKIIDTAMRSGAVIHGPTPLPTKIRKFTVNRSTFVHKDARDQFEMRTHRRLIDLTDTTFKTVDALQNLSLPSGVDIEIRM